MTTIELFASLTPRERLIMAAGIVNVRGTFVLSRRRVIPDIVFQFESNAHLEGVELFGKLLDRPYTMFGHKGKVARRVAMQGSPLYKVIDDLWPHLTEVRKTEIKLLLRQRDAIIGIIKEHHNGSIS